MDRNQRTFAIAFIGLVVLLVAGCASKDRNNPLDAQGTTVDPYDLQVGLTRDGIHLQWQNVSIEGVAGYRVYRSLDPDDRGQIAGFVSSGGSSYADTTALHGVINWYRLVAVDSHDKESRLSEPESVTVRGARLSASLSLWTPGPGIDSLYLHIASDSIPCRFAYVVSSDTGWVTVGKSAGVAPDSVQIRVGANSSGSRTCHLVLVAADVTGTPDTVTIVQQANGQQPVLVVSPDSLDLPGMGGTSDLISVNLLNSASDPDYTITTDATWLHLSVSSGTSPGSFSATADDNFTESVRDGLVIVRAAGSSATADTLYVHQPRMVWSSPYGGGFDDWVTSLAVYNGDLIAGGFFANAGTASTGKVAVWNGAEWSGIGLDPGQNNWVNCLSVYHGRLVMGGQFPGWIMGGQTNSNVISWDGVSFHSLDGGLLGQYVNDMKVIAGWLIAGGEMQITNPASEFGVLKWGGAHWYTMGASPNGYVKSVVEYNGDVVVGGTFEQITSGVVNNLAGWNGAAWNGIGNGVTSTVSSARVNAMTIWNGKLVVAGRFLKAGNLAAHNIAMWDGTTWSVIGDPVAEGTDGEVTGLCTFMGKLIVAGDFGIAGDLQVDGMAFWDGQSWHGMGQSPSNPRPVWKSAFLQLGDDLVVGGAFTTAGGYVANHIARLGEQD